MESLISASVWLGRLQSDLCRFAERDHIMIESYPENMRVVDLVKVGRDLYSSMASVDVSSDDLKGLALTANVGRLMAEEYLNNVRSR